MGKFSVIIPSRDRPGYLREAVASVLAQTHDELEVLIINDGENAVVPFADQRVKIFENGRQGPVVARNLGVSVASGEYFAFLDDDDVWIDPSHLTKANATLSGLGEFYFTNGIMSFPNGRTRNFARRANLKSLRLDNTILISTVCYSRSLHDELGLFDEALPYYWDWDWYLRVAQAGHVLQHRKIAAANIRVHEQNMSGGANLAERRANLDLLCAKHRLGFIEVKNHTDFV